MFAKLDGRWVSEGVKLRGRPRQEKKYRKKKKKKKKRSHHKSVKPKKKEVTKTRAKLRESV